MLKKFMALLTITALLVSSTACGTASPTQGKAAANKHKSVEDQIAAGLSESLKNQFPLAGSAGRLDTDIIAAIPAEYVNSSDDTESVYVTDPVFSNLHIIEEAERDSGIVYKCEVNMKNRFWEGDMTFFVKAPQSDGGRLDIAIYDPPLVTPTTPLDVTDPKLIELLEDDNFGYYSSEDYIIEYTNKYRDYILYDKHTALNTKTVEKIEARESEKDPNGRILIDIFFKDGRIISGPIIAMYRPRSIRPKGIDYYESYNEFLEELPQENDIMLWQVYRADDNNNGEAFHMIKDGAKP